MSRMLDRYSAAASRALYALGTYCALPLLLTLVIADVLLRYFFNAPLQWSRDANGLLLLVTLFSGLPYCWDRGQHIRMEVFYARTVGRLRIAADVVAAVAGVVSFAMLAAGAAYFALYMRQTGETGEELIVPVWPFMAYMGLCSATLALRIVANPTAATTDESGSWT